MYTASALYSHAYLFSFVLSGRTRTHTFVYIHAYAHTRTYLSEYGFCFFIFYDPDICLSFRLNQKKKITTKSNNRPAAKRHRYKYTFIRTYCTVKYSNICVEKGNQKPIRLSFRPGFTAAWQRTSGGAQRVSFSSVASPPPSPRRLDQRSSFCVQYFRNHFGSVVNARRPRRNSVAGDRRKTVHERANRNHEMFFRVIDIYCTSCFRSIR